MKQRPEFSDSFPSDLSRGCSLPRVFPLPPFCTDGRAQRYTMGSMVEDSTCVLARGVNLAQAVLNMLFGSKQETPRFLTAAHRRIQARLESGWSSMMVEATTVEDDELRQFLKHQQHYAGGGTAIPLGDRGGVPANAATVDLRKELRDQYPKMSHHVNEPTALLLPSGRRPKRIKRGHVWLHGSYPALVVRNVKAGLHILKKPSQVARHRGRLCLAGAFAVPKDADEDRVITDPSVNQLVDPDELPRPKFAYIPKLRVTYAPRGGVLVVSKRDARHYFHSLKIGRKWHRWLCGPPIFMSGGKLRFPACCTAPMGFGPSAGWAQALTDVTTSAADMPRERRLHPDECAPGDFPLWGSIYDDIWAIDHAQGDDQRDLHGPGWLSRAEQAWVDRGVHPNTKKSIDAAEGAEVQGYFVHPTKHWLGVSVQKRMKLFQATFYLLSLQRVLVSDMERWVGKYGYVHSCRPPMRSIFADTYRWLEQMRASKARFAILPDAVWLECMYAALLLPYCQFDVSSPYSNRVECSDSSMTGIGRAWTCVPSEVVQSMAQLCDHPGTYTNLALPHGIGLQETQTCPLAKLALPSDVFWHKVGAPYRPLYIYLGEADAAVWVAEDRLRRPVDDGGRFAHPLDSACCVGAFSKGRSASKLLNERCRKLCAVAVAGGHEVFYPWIASAENPADEPSRRFEGGRGEDYRPEPQALQQLHADPFTPQNWSGNERFFLHLCSGVPRKGDLISAICALTTEQGLSVLGLRVGPAASYDQCERCLIGSDLVTGKHVQTVLDLIHSGRVLGAYASPPDRTFSNVLRVTADEERSFSVVRKKRDVWRCSHGCSRRRQREVTLESTLALLCIGLIGEVRLCGGWVAFKHRARTSAPSVFQSSEAQMLIAIAHLEYYSAEDLLPGHNGQPTGFLLPSGSKPSVQAQAGYPRSRLEVACPSAVNVRLAQLFVEKAIQARANGFQQPCKPLLVGHGGDGVEPWCGVGRTLWQWPEPCRGFLAECIKRCDKSSL